MKPTEIKIVSYDVPCAQALYCFIPNGKRAIKKEWAKARELYEADTNLGKRIVTPVTIIGYGTTTDKSKTDKSKDSKFDGSINPIYMMDALTGSLYDIITGRCLTSVEVYMTDFVMRKNLMEKLLTIESEQPV